MGTAVWAEDQPGSSLGLNRIRKWRPEVHGSVRLRISGARRGS